MENAKKSRKKQITKPYPLVASGSPGFTLILAALISSIVLSIGAAIFSIALKQVALASAGKNSQFAFYAADTAAECALYWDVRFQSFATSSSARQPTTAIQCDQPADIAVVMTGNADGSADSSFFYAPGQGDGTGYCADVKVTKSRDALTNGVVTKIHANGYSTKVSDPSQCNPSSGSYAISQDHNALQRSVELHY